MIEIVKGFCPNCGGDVSLNDNETIATCNSCRSDFLIDKSINISGLEEIEIIKEIIPKKQVIVKQSISPVDNLIKRGNMHLDENGFNDARDCFNKALDIDVEVGEAYWGLFFVEEGINKEDLKSSIPTYKDCLINNSNVKKAYKFGDEILKTTINKLNDDFNVRVNSRKDGVNKDCSHTFDFIIRNGVLIKYKDYKSHVIIPDGITCIGNGAFYRCFLLESIEIPNSVTSIGDSAFTGCSMLQNIKIPNSATSIGDSAFSECTKLQNIKIPNSVISIGNWAFDRCSSLESIEVPNSVTSIGNWAFCNCDSLQSIEIPNSVTSIGDDVFYECNSLESVVTPVVGDKMFYRFKNLRRVEILNGATAIGSEAFYYCDSLERVEIPDSVESIGSKAFYGCSELTRIGINKVVNIGENAFCYCRGLDRIDISHAKVISESAFSGCSGLGYIEIPADIKILGDRAFECSGLHEVYALCEKSLVNKNVFGPYCQPNVFYCSYVKSRTYIKSGVCRYCGGKFKGLFAKTCSVCGKPKDY